MTARNKATLSQVALLLKAATGRTETYGPTPAMSALSISLRTRR